MFSFALAYFIYVSEQVNDDDDDDKSLGMRALQDVIFRENLWKIRCCFFVVLC